MNTAVSACSGDGAAHCVDGQAADIGFRAGDVLNNLIGRGREGLKVNIISVCQPGQGEHRERRGQNSPRMFHVFLVIQIHLLGNLCQYNSTIPPL